MSSGTFTIGANTFDVNCVAPRFTYALTEYARIPRYTELHKEHACLVGDLTQYSASVAAAEAAATVTGVSPGGNVNATGAVTSGAGRTLLQFDAVGVAALAIGITALKTANRAMATASAALDIANQDLSDIKNLTGIVGNMQSAANLTSQAVHQLQAVTSDNSASIAGLQTAANKTNAAIGALNTMTTQLANNVTAMQVALDTAITNTQNNLAAGLTAESQFFTQALTNTTTAISKQFVVNSANVAYLMAQVQKGSSDLLTLTSTVFDLYQSLQLRQMITASYFQSLAELDPSLQPVISDAGVAPQLNGLQGQDQRILVDSVTLNFVQAGSNADVLVSHVYNLYVDAAYAVGTMRPWTTFASILSNVGPAATCWRRYPGTDVPVQGDEDPAHPCNMWVEVVIHTCNAPAGTHPGWKTMDTTKGLADQPIALASAMCDASGVVLQPGKLLRSFTAWMAFVQANACTVSLNSNAYFQFFIQSLGGIVYIPQVTSTCGFSLNQILAADVRTSPSLFGYMFALVSMGFPNVLPRVYAASMKLYGRLPAGLSFETEPLSYVPTQTRADGSVIYDGGADPHMCINAYWLATSTDTVPLFDVAPYPEFGVAKRVVFSNANSATCTAGSPNCYVVADPQASDITLENDMSFLLPSEWVMAGEPSGWAVAGVYDVPDSMIAGSPSVRAGINRVDYFNMPPGTLQTQSLDQFNLAHGGEYKAQDGAVSVSSYLYGALDDGTGSPVCNTNGGLPTALALQLNAANECRWGATYHHDYDFSLESGACALAAKQPGATAATTTQVLVDWQQGVTYAAAIAPRVLQTDDASSFALVHDAATRSPTVAVSWWFGMAASGTDALKAASPTAVFTLDLFNNGYLRVSMLAYAATGVVCPTVSVGVVSGGQYASMGAGTTSCIAVQDLYVSHHFYARATTSAAGAVTIQLWVDGLAAATVTGAAVANGGNVASGTGGEQDLGLATMVSAASTSVSATSFLVSDLRIFSGAAAVMGATDLTVKLTAACQPPRLYGTGCMPGNATTSVTVMYQDHRSACTSALTAHSALLFSTALVKPTAPAAGTMLTKWSATAWLRASNTQAAGTLTSLVAFASKGIELFYLAGAGGALVVCKSGSVCFKTASSIGVLWTQPAFVALAVPSAGATPVLFVNGAPTVLLEFAAPSAYGQAGAAAGYPAYDATGMIEFVTLFDGVVMQTADAAQEQQCQIRSIHSVSADATAWRAPVAVCVADDAASVHGHCRSQAMCGGNCAMSATWTSGHGMFEPLAPICDHGYEAPSCLAACVRTDPVTGYCLDPTLASTRATGATPNGRRCELLRNFQERAGTLNGQRVLTYTPRTWSYITTLTVPSGVITTLATQGTCPQVSATDGGDGSVAVLLQNTGAGGAATVSVAYYYTDPALQSSDACTSGLCCNYAGQVVTIAPYTTSRAVVPAGCGNVTVVVQLETAGKFAPCTTLSADTLNALVLGSVTSTTAAIDARVSVQVDAVTNAVTTQAAAITGSILQVMLNTAVAQGQSNASVAYLTGLINSIASNQQPTVTFDNITVVTLSNPELEAGIQANLAASNEALQASQNASAQAIIDTAAVTATLAALDAQNAANLASWTAFAGMVANQTYGVAAGSSDCGGDPFEAVACAIGGIGGLAVGAVNDVKDLTIAVVDAAASAAKAATGAGTGVLNGMLSGVWDILLLGVVCVVGAGVVYLGFKWVMNKQSNRAYAPVAYQNSRA